MTGTSSQGRQRHRKLYRGFYLQSAAAVARSFLGKVLVHQTEWGRLAGVIHQTEWGRLAGVIHDVEAYPAFVDGVHHGNKRTRPAR